MIILKLKSIIISSRIGMKIDSYLRRLLSAWPWLHSRLSQKRRRLAPDCFVFFLYGGIGDVILTLPLIDRLSRAGRPVLYCDERIAGLSFLFPQNAKVILYDKHSVLKLRKHRNSQDCRESIFIQTSPIFELYVIRMLLGLPNSIGLLTGFGEIQSTGFCVEPRKLDDRSRLHAYESIYEVLSHAIDLHESGEGAARAGQRLPKSGRQIIPEQPYVVISPMKSAQWEMGKMADSEYIRVAEYLITKHGFTAVFVGSSSECEHIDAMIARSVHAGSMLNLAGKTDLADLAQVLQSAEFIVSNDNGVSHLASYLKLKILVLFMFSDPAVYGWPHTGYAYLFNRRHSCMPCVGRNPFPQDNYPVYCPNSLACNRTISAEAVIGKINNLRWV